MQVPRGPDGSTCAELHVQSERNAGEIQRGSKSAYNRDVLTWPSGRWEIFDASFEHEVWNNCTTERLVLVLELPHPSISGSGA